MIIERYRHFGGRHGESAAIKNLLAFAGVVNPVDGKPFSEALCFGIAGGIGAGYSFCPSVVRYGAGSGVSIVGRHKIYATDAAWYQGFCDRIGARTRVTETTGKGKAYQNLLAELQAGRPAVVWCSRMRLPFFDSATVAHDLWMHTFIVYGIDESKGCAYGADCAPTPVTLSLDELAGARGGICSHRNRTLTLDPPEEMTPAVVASAVREGIRACVQEMFEPRMKTFSLPGLELWARMICNSSNKEGWGVVFPDGLRFCALRSVFTSIETNGTGGGLYRRLFADFLDEAAEITGNEELAELAGVYCALAKQWTALADAALPDAVEPFRQAKALLREKRRLFEEQGEEAMDRIAEASEKLDAIEAELRASFPLATDEWASVREDLRERIYALHRAESEAAARLQDAEAR